MVDFFPPIAVLVALLWIIPNSSYGQKITQLNNLDDDEQQRKIGVISSSSFEMSLFPTLEKLNNVATNKIQRTIKNTLVLSSSVTTGFDSLDTIEVQIQRVEFKHNLLRGALTTTASTNSSSSNTDSFDNDDEDNDSDNKHDNTNYNSKNNTEDQEKILHTSLLVFEARMYFNGVEDNKSSLSSSTSTSSSPLPTQFSLDNLIVKTFSQPSTKTTFIKRLIQTRDPSLIEIKEISINLVEGSSSAVDVDDGTGVSHLSNIDIVLIAASLVTVIGIICITVMHFKKQNDFRHIRHKNSFNNDVDDVGVSGDNTPDETPNFTINESNDNVSSLGVEDNIIEACSLESSGHSQSRTSLSINEVGSVESSVGSQSQVVASNVDSPAMSYASSSSSASVFSATSLGSSESNCTPFTEEKSDASREMFIISKKEQPTTNPKSSLSGSIDQCRGNNATLLTSTSSGNLGSKLFNHFGAKYYDLANKARAGHSIASAPTILEQSIQRSKNQVKEVEPPFKIIRSISSESLNVKCIRDEVLNNPILTATAEEFRTSWFESKEKALEDVEEGSVQDVFRVGIDQHNVPIQESQTCIKSTASVSEWMKSIHVVSSASETLSSVEYSSIEPKLSFGKDSSSTDLSLEDSLASSMVEI